MSSNWFFSEGASNLGTFLSGISAVGAIIIGVREYKRWKEEKRLEQKSKRAEKAAHKLFECSPEILEWINCSQSSPEIRNVINRSYTILENLNYVKFYGGPLDKDILNLVEDLQRLIKQQTLNLKERHFAEENQDEKLKKKARNNLLDLSTEEIQPTISSIENKLKPFIFFE